MKKMGLVLLVTILTLSMAGLVIASDITNAGYRTTIAISNNSTAATNVAVPFNLSTFEMIERGMLSANASDAAMIESGADAPFMPASDNSSPWVTWVSSIGTDSQVDQFLYTLGASGGEIRYFPGAAGMSANDSATLELADNFTIEQSGWIDTTQVGANLTDKYKAFRTYISAAGNITSGIWDWNNTTSFTDVGGDWSNETNAYDNDMSTNATVSFGGVGWGGYLELLQDAPYAELLQYYIGIDTNPDITQIDLDAYYSGGWNDVYQGAYSEELWTTHSLGASYNVTNIRMRVYNQVAGGRSLELTELAAGQFYPNITASGVSSGEHVVSANYTPDLLLNGGFEDWTAGTPDDWVGTRVTTSNLTGDVQQGTYSVNITCNDAGGAGVAFIRQDMSAEIRSHMSGQTATLYFWYKVPVANPYSVTAYIRDNEGASPLILTKDGAWHEATITRDIAVAASDLEVDFWVKNLAAADTTNYMIVDSAIFILGDSITSYDTFRLFVDTVEMDAVYTTIPVPDNSENWTFFENGVMPYVEYHQISVNRTLQQHIAWEYDPALFTDLSGQGHHAAPSFRTTSSNPNVSAEVSGQEGLFEGSTPTSNITGGWTMIASAPTAPEDLFAEGGDSYAVGGFDWGGMVTDYADDAGHPPEPYHFLIAFGLAIIAILGVYEFTHNTQMGRQGSLSLAFLAGGIVLVLFYRYTTIPGWILIPYGLGALLLIMWKRSPSPVD